MTIYRDLSIIQFSFDENGSPVVISVCYHPSSILNFRKRHWVCQLGGVDITSFRVCILSTWANDIFYRTISDGTETVIESHINGIPVQPVSKDARASTNSHCNGALVCSCVYGDDHTCWTKTDKYLLLSIIQDRPGPIYRNVIQAVPSVWISWCTITSGSVRDDLPCTHIILLYTVGLVICHEQLVVRQCSQLRSRTAKKLDLFLRVWGGLFSISACNHSQPVTHMYPQFTCHHIIRYWASLRSYSLSFS